MNSKQLSETSNTNELAQQVAAFFTQLRANSEGNSDPTTTTAPYQAYKNNAFNRPPTRGRGRPRGSYSSRGRGNSRFTNDEQDPNNRRCYTCNRFGHMAKDCIRNNQASSPRGNQGYQRVFQGNSQRYRQHPQYYKTAVTWYDHYAPLRPFPIRCHLSQSRCITHQCRKRPLRRATARYMLQIRAQSKPQLQEPRTRRCRMFPRIATNFKPTKIRIRET